MPYSRWRMPDWAVTSSNVPFRRLRYRRCLAVAAILGSATDPPSTMKMSIQPSSSKSKNRPPDPMISAKYLSGLAPLTCVTLSPADAAMSLKTTSADVADVRCCRAGSSAAARHSAMTRTIGLRHRPIGREHDLRTRVIQQGQGEILHGAFGSHG